MVPYWKTNHRQAGKRASTTLRLEVMATFVLTDFVPSESEKVGSAGCINFESLHPFSILGSHNYIVGSPEMDVWTSILVQNSLECHFVTSKSVQTVLFFITHRLEPITPTTGPQICTETEYAHYGATKIHENEEGGELEEFRI